MWFPERYTTIKKVQQLLGLLDDGDDGEKTWKAILNFIQEKTGVINPPSRIDPPSTSQYPERVLMSQQTHGAYAQKIRPEAIVLHHTSGNYDGSVDWTNRTHDSNGKRLYASYHVIIARDGRRTVMNEDDNRAYHAGVSAFKGKPSLNNWSIGVAFERDTNTEPLQKEAIESAIEFILPRMKKWGLDLSDVTDHRIVALPKGRKNDLAPTEYDKFMSYLKEAWEKYQ